MNKAESFEYDGVPIVSCILIRFFKPPSAIQEEEQKYECNVMYACEYTHLLI